MPQATVQLRARLAELADLHHAGSLMHWDQQTQMPPGGAEARAEALATLERMTHELFVSDDTGRRIERAAAELDGADPDGDDARIVRFVRRSFEKSRRVPPQLAADFARAASLGQEAWVLARQSSDFTAFAPHLERNLELKAQYVELFTGDPGFHFAGPYDVLLDDFETGMTTAEVTGLFAELKAALVPLIARASERSAAVDDRPLHSDVPVERQRKLVRRVLERMGFTGDRWRLDDAVHPFALSLGSHDVRITTRWDERYFPSALFGAMHECGHGLYEAGIADGLQRTPVGTATALALHESQSRLWENMVGRSAPFSRFLAPLVRDTLAVEVRPRDLFRAVNRVEPSLIRVEADEATYGLHIILRFELEQELIEGRLAVRDLPAAWNAKVDELLSLDVPDDAHGVLQDVHWAGGAIGYFPTYSLGNLVAGQLWARLRSDLPELDDRLAAGELSPLREWLREHVHRHGSKFTTAEIVARVTGEPIRVAPFVAYLEAKLADALS